MSKIICDLCGTSYAETAAQCPICGTAKTDASRTRPGGDTADSYAYVKGGRFSESNVRRRTGSQSAPSRSRNTRREPQENDGANTGLKIVVAVLLLAIVCVFAFIAIKIISANKPDEGTQTSQSTQANTDQVSCTGISLSQKQWEFTGLNQTLLLQVILEPNDTTEKVYFRSSNENVVTVDESGLITPVADGEASIYVTCGGLQESCTIVCNVGVEPQQPSQPSDPSEPSTPPVEDVELVLNRSDFTLRGYGSYWNLSIASEGYIGPDPSLVTWTSDDPTIATVENGKVTAVGNGNTIVRAEYGGKVVECDVRCKDVVVPVETGYYLSSTEFSMNVGTTESISLYAKADSSKVQGATFRVEDASVCTVDERGRVKALETGRGKNTVVYVEYEGHTYECLVRVRATDL